MFTKLNISKYVFQKNGSSNLFIDKKPVVAHRNRVLVIVLKDDLTNSKACVKTK